LSVQLSAELIQGGNLPWITGARVITGLIQLIQMIQVKKQFIKNLLS